MAFLNPLDALILKIPFSVPSLTRTILLWACPAVMGHGLMRVPPEEMMTMMNDVFWCFGFSLSGGRGSQGVSNVCSGDRRARGARAVPALRTAAPQTGTASRCTASPS